MRKADIYVQRSKAGTFTEFDKRNYEIQYDPNYRGHPISLTLKVRTEPYTFTDFPTFFDGLLPEGAQLDALLRQRKIDKNDHFSQLLAVGEDLVGAVQVKESDAS